MVQVSPVIIVGNISDDTKQDIGSHVEVLLRDPPLDSACFAKDIQNRLRVTEISIIPNAEEPKKTEARVVVEIDVTQDMVNLADTLHGGCSAYLVDICSTLAIHTLFIVKSESSDHPFSVSQSLNLIYHAPAAVGEELRIINTTLTLGARALSARTEIWSRTHNRLVASGTHIKMIPGTKARM